MTVKKIFVVTWLSTITAHSQKKGQHFPNNVKIEFLTSHKQLLSNIIQGL